MDSTSPSWCFEDLTIKDLAKSFDPQPALQSLSARLRKSAKLFRSNAHLS
jgi:hypothetical protein